MEFILPPNSITFVSIEPMLRLPEYIALRFNLKIRHVHKGLLLGTGPLVDPGFCGRLFIPLHNLTTNSYSFKGGDGLIWFEFTKISEHEKWSWRDRERPLGRLGQLGRTPTPTENTTPLEYIRRAVGPERSIVSSIPDALQKASHSAEEAERQVRRLGELFTIGGVIAVIALLLTIGFGVIPIYSLVEQSDSLVSGTTQDNLAEIKRTQRELEGRVKILESRVTADESKPAPTATVPDLLLRQRKNHLPARYGDNRGWLAQNRPTPFSNRTGRRSCLRKDHASSCA